MEELVEDNRPTSIPLKFSGCVLIKILKFAPYMRYPDHDGGCGSGWPACGGGTAWNLHVVETQGHQRSLAGWNVYGCV
jgi:hypothetical protein